MWLIISYWTTQRENEDDGIPHLGQVEGDLQRAQAVLQAQSVGLQEQQIGDAHEARCGHENRQYGCPTWDEKRGSCEIFIANRLHINMKKLTIEMNYGVF